MNGEKCDISLTIELQLKRYTEDSRKTERHEILWHAWKHNKIWLTQLQKWILLSYPHYSYHDDSHSISILQNIEMILGEEQIKLLSASDCFMLLHVAYIHDIGMCLTYNDHINLAGDNEFIAFLKEQIREGSSVKRYAEIILDYCMETEGFTTDTEKIRKRIDVYYAITYLISEYKRKDHGNKSNKILNEWIDKPEKLGIGFSTSGIPSRFYHTIAACASTHTSWDFGKVMELSKRDSGFAHDYMHPRFVAVMLQLGDALDIDNDRFSPLAKEFLNELPIESELHRRKHGSIRRLRISPNKLTIEADSDSVEVLRLVYDECNGIKEVLKNATYHWAAICPENLPAAHLPVFEPLSLYLRGQKVKECLVNAQFRIQQEKAFDLLKGNNVYENNRMVFLRELIQNAIDATKIQYWTVWKGSNWYDENRDSSTYTAHYMGCRLSPVAGIVSNRNRTSYCKKRKAWK